MRKLKRNMFYFSPEAIVYCISSHSVIAVSPTSFPGSAGGYGDAGDWDGSHGGGYNDDSGWGNDDSGAGGYGEGDWPD